MIVLVSGGPASALVAGPLKCQPWALVPRCVEAGLDTWLAIAPLFRQFTSLTMDNTVLWIK